MRIKKEQIQDINSSHFDYEKELDVLKQSLDKKGINVENLIQKIINFQVAIPSWALGAGGTRFGRFGFGGEPATLDQKIEDIGVLHTLTNTAGAVSLHIPWDIPKDPNAIKQLANELNIKFDAMNSNTFQDQRGAKVSYKFGSLNSIHDSARDSAIQHNIDVIHIGQQLGSKGLTVWLADGANFPGQHNFQKALRNTQDSLIQIYEQLPHDWKLFIEYKPYEPNFYSTTIQDWGTSFLLAQNCGERAYTLVDLGHHLPNTNIEQIVSTLMLQGKLGGFHFNDSKYGDDDLTVGSIKPYALFLIFNELIYGMKNNPQNPELAWMIDASHNTKDPLEDLLQSLEAILMAYTQASIVDQKALEAAQNESDVVLCQELLQDAYRTDVRPLIKEARRRSGAAINPLNTYRKMQIRTRLIEERGLEVQATGL